MSTVWIQPTMRFIFPRFKHRGLQYDKGTPLGNMLLRLRKTNNSIKTPVEDSSAPLGLGSFSKRVQGILQSPGFSSSVSFVRLVKKKKKLNKTWSRESHHTPLECLFSETMWKTPLSFTPVRSPSHNVMLCFFSFTPRLSTDKGIITLLLCKMLEWSQGTPRKPQVL